MGAGGKVVLVATPIGNLDDLSPRAAAALCEADVIAAEDTRRSGSLLARIGATAPLVSYHEHNEATRTGQLLERVREGEVVALVTDAGTPGVSDPGFVLVRAAIDGGLAVEAVPGPVAAIQALVLSGLPTDRFVMEGFLPRKAGARTRRLRELATEPRTMICYVSPHRAAADLAAMAEAFGDERPAALARELTKRYEEVRRGTLGELATAAPHGLRGELTLVVGGAPEVLADLDDDELVERVRALIAAGSDKKSAIARVARAAALPKKRVYQAVLDAEG